MAVGSLVSMAASNYCADSDEWRLQPRAAILRASKTQ